MARTANTRIKVKRETLIVKLREARAKREQDYLKNLERYDGDRGRLAHALATDVAAFTALLNADPDKALARVESDYDRGVKIRFPKLKLPTKPGLQTADIDRLLRVLEVAEDEIVSIAADDDYARFL